LTRGRSPISYSPPYVARRLFSLFLRNPVSSFGLFIFAGRAMPNRFGLLGFSLEEHFFFLCVHLYFLIVPHFPYGA